MWRNDAKMKKCCGMFLRLWLWIGVVIVPSAAGGFLLASIFIKRLSLTVGQQLRSMFFLSIVSLCAMSMFAVQCDTAPFVPRTDT